MSSANINFAKIEWKLVNTTATYGTSNNTLVTVNGVKFLDGISLNDKTVTLSQAALGTDKVTISDGYTLALADDVTKPSTTKGWSLNGTTATYNQTTTAGYTLADNAITYSEKSVETLATVKGVKSLDGLSLNEKVVTLSKAALGTDKVTISDGYTLALADDVPKSLTTKGWSLNGTAATYDQTTTAGYTLADNAITYSEKSVETLATVKGVKSLDGLSLNEKVVTLSQAALGMDKVTISDGYTLALADDVPKSLTTKDWSLNKTTATYKQTTKAGYTLADNSITYSEKSVETLATVKGVKSLDGLSLNEKVVTLSKAALGMDKVTISDGYTLALADDVTKPSTTKDWNLNGTTATYDQTTTAGYTLADNSITYSEKSVETLATVNGVKSLDGLKIEGNVIAVSKAALNKKKVTVSEGYTLALADDVTKSSTKKAWSLNKTTATYKQTTKAGYTLADNAITYSKNRLRHWRLLRALNLSTGFQLKEMLLQFPKRLLTRKMSRSATATRLNLTKMLPSLRRKKLGA